MSVTVAVPPRHGLPIVVLPETAIVTFESAAAMLMVALPARADPADIAAASRGVVRVVLVQSDGETVQYVGHGSGFAVSPTLIVTNAHVIAPANGDDTMLLGVVPTVASLFGSVTP